MSRMIKMIETDFLQSLILSDGYKQSLVGCIQFNREELNHHYSDNAEARRVVETLPVAFSIGGVVPPIRYLVTPPGAPVGLIAIDSEFIKCFDSNEIKFILAHEYSHIQRNHTSVKALGIVGANLVRDYINTIKDSTLRNITHIAFEALSAKLNVEFQKSFELEADSNAVRLTGNKQSGINTLNKIVESSPNISLDTPSHYIEKGGVYYPIVTYGERLVNLN